MTSSISFPTFPSSGTASISIESTRIKSTTLIELINVELQILDFGIYFTIYKLFENSCRFRPNFVFRFVFRFSEPETLGRKSDQFHLDRSIDRLASFVTRFVSFELNTKPTPHQTTSNHQLNKPTQFIRSLFIIIIENIRNERIEINQNNSTYKFHNQHV